MKMINVKFGFVFLGIILLSAVMTRGFATGHRENVVDRSNYVASCYHSFYTRAVELLEELFASENYADFINMLNDVTFTKVSPNVYQRLIFLLNEINIKLRSGLLCQDEQFQLTLMRSLLNAAVTNRLAVSNTEGTAGVLSASLLSNQLFYIKIVDKLEELFASEKYVRFMSMLRYVTFVDATPSIYKRLSRLLNEINLKRQSKVTCQKARLQLTQMATLLVETLPVKFCFFTSASQ